MKEQAKRSQREEEMATLAAQYQLAFKPDTVSILNEHDFIYLRRGTDKQEYHVIHGSFLGGEVRLFDYSHTAAPAYYSNHWHTVITFVPDDKNSVADFVIAPGHYLERYLVSLEEQKLKADSYGFAGHYRLYSKREQAKPTLSNDMKQYFMQHQ
ncbi:MAG: SulP family inorganic anion transporter, partial [Pseudomonadota bacterium]|nr:SulP family inorganic anion transporter [Pseudomonadota bacterium]